MILGRNAFPPRVSVIVPVRNEAAHLRRTLDGLTNQRFPAEDVEILVVDGDSEDGTPDLVREYQSHHDNVRLFFNSRRLSSAARNIAVLQSRGDFLVLIDGHCEIQNPDYLANLVEAFDTSEADTLGRPQPLKAGKLTPFQRAVSAARMSWLGHNPDSAIFDNQPRFVPADNVAVAYRREVFDRVGLFDESFDACEDVDFNTRVRQAGFNCYFTPTISVDYQPRRSLRALGYQMMRYGQGRARLARKDRSSITLPSLALPMALVGLIVGSIAGIIWWPVGLLVLAGIAGYVLLVTGESLRLATHVPPTVATGKLIDREEMLVPDVRLETPPKKTKNAGLLLRLPLVFPAIHLGFAWGYLREIVWGRPLKPAPLMVSRMETVPPSDSQTHQTPSVAA
ncbi:glycosyltransferase family 2 protein [Zavarzinella formosa]|uniref:glycosyltransferase family 2 protein n=1 Tax=Zavarzinella formosa TaxID=360055 RepID=UPI0003772013|nr:glycosyltransferase family 2 protein [Zavarzinella formosa]